MFCLAGAKFSLRADDDMSKRAVPRLGLCRGWEDGLQNGAREACFRDSRALPVLRMEAAFGLTDPLQHEQHMSATTSELQPPAALASATAAGGRTSMLMAGGSDSGDEGAEWHQASGGGAVPEGTFRKRGRPRKYEGLDEEERRKRRMADNRQSAKR